MSHLIRIYTVSHPVLDLRRKILFAAVDMSKFKDGRVHFRIGTFVKIVLPFLKGGYCKRKEFVPIDGGIGICVL